MYFNQILIATTKIVITIRGRIIAIIILIVNQYNVINVINHMFLTNINIFRFNDRISECLIIINIIIFEYPTTTTIIIFDHLTIIVIPIIIIFPNKL